jgi:hypothetical protein
MVKGLPRNLVGGVSESLLELLGSRLGRVGLEAFLGLYFSSLASIQQKTMKPNLLVEKSLRPASAMLMIDCLD